MSRCANRPQVDAGPEEDLNAGRGGSRERHADVDVAVSNLLRHGRGMLNAEYDGIHESGYGAWQEGRVLAREFQRRGVPRRYPRTIFSGDTAYGPKDTTPPQSPAGNALGTQGTFDKPGNAAGMQVTGGGGVTGAEFWPGDNGGSMYTRLTGTLNGTAAIAISTQPCSFLNEEGFRGDITRPRLTFSGTPAASFALTLQIYRNLYQQQGSATTLPNNVTMESEFCWQANSLVGLGNTRGPGSLGSGGVG